MRELGVPDLVQGGWRDLDFEPFRHGVTVHWLHKGEGDEPTVAILKYLPEARVPKHRHAGLETILVLDGIQSDECGDHPAGSLVLNPTGTEHSVWTDAGCVVLIQWDRPVVIVEEEYAR
jgi:anti-sigma factor ChrR (cupin superfamily)